MTTRPAGPPPAPRRDISAAERSAITSVLGELPDPLLHAVRDARGHDFQRLEFVGDAVLELVVRFHADVAGASCPRCGGDADAVVTDAALARVAQAAHLDSWLEWEASHARQADLVEACAGAVWAGRGWLELAEFTDAVVHPLTPVAPGDVVSGWHGDPPPPSRRGHEVMGASVIEVAAASLAFRGSDGNEGELTGLRNHTYATARVVDRARKAGWLDPHETSTTRLEAALSRDVVERRLADLAFTSGLEAAVDAATALLA